MKLIELEINNIRGIKQTLIRPNGKNVVIWGPNGSGKSAVVDAIDFLLTGHISRLMGKGTGNITLTRHGPHIDCRPEDATVRAIIQLSRSKKQIDIKRCIAHPNDLICEGADTSELEPLMSLANRGQHVLTRREILRYITAEGSTRAQEIQELLNITEIEDVRRAFVKIQNEFSKELQATKKNLDMAKGSVNATVGQVSYQSEVIVNVINQNRAVLGANSISLPKSNELKAGIKLPTAVGGKQSINITLLEGDLTNLKTVIAHQNQVEVSLIDNKLRSLITEVKLNPTLLISLSRQKLIDLGIELVDESGKCPLCDTSWPPGELQIYLEEKSKLAQTAVHYQEQASILSEQLTSRIESIIANIKKVIAASQLANIQEEINILRIWQTELEAFSETLSDVFSKYDTKTYSIDNVQRLLAPEKLIGTLDFISEKVKEKFPVSTPEQTAWTTLTQLEENLKVLEKAQADFDNATIANSRANMLLIEFQRARDSVLRNLYDDIRDRFVSLYKQLHGTDEKNFQARIEPDGAALNIEVDFYGRGIHPPHALHSEGHQDSMGLCLYLALAEKLTGGLIDLTILDDVVMSVDTEHRKALCHLIAIAFPGRQFLITTHDRTWAHQLRSENIVDSKGSIEFYNWKVETGPQVNYETDFWKKIEVDLEKNDVSIAAGRLRRASEQYFGSVCDSLQAPVKFRLDGRWELGDLMPAAVGQYNRLLRKAKAAAQSWKNDGLIRDINETETTVEQIYKRTQAEQWAINENIHHNNWENFEKNDFIPVVQAFQDLFALFTCSTCGKMLYVTQSSGVLHTIKCDCGVVNWNLIAQKNHS